MRFRKSDIELSGRCFEPTDMTSCDYCVFNNMESGICKAAISKIVLNYLDFNESEKHIITKCCVTYSVCSTCIRQNDGSSLSCYKHISRSIYKNANNRKNN